MFRCSQVHGTRISFLFYFFFSLDEYVHFQIYTVFVLLSLFLLHFIIHYFRSFFFFFFFYLFYLNSLPERFGCHCLLAVTISFPFGPCSIGCISTWKLCTLLSMRCRHWASLMSLKEEWMEKKTFLKCLWATSSPANDKRTYIYRHFKFTDTSLYTIQPFHSCSTNHLHLTN